MLRSNSAIKFIILLPRASCKHQARLPGGKTSLFHRGEPSFFDKDHLPIDKYLCHCYNKANEMTNILVILTSMLVK